MKLTRLDHVPDDVDGKLFHTILTLRPDIETWQIQQWTAAVLRELAQGTELENPVEFVWLDDNGKLHLSAFGILNGLFMHFCPGYRLMVTEGPEEERRLWVALEEEDTVPVAEVGSSRPRWWHDPFVLRMRERELGLDEDDDEDEDDEDEGDEGIDSTNADGADISACLHEEITPDGYVEFEPGALVFHVNCRACGRSGSTTVRPGDVLW